MNNRGFMTGEQAREFMRGIDDPGGALGSNLPPDAVLDNPETLRLAELRIARIEEELLPEVRERLEEDRVAMETFVKAQPPRNWERTREWWRKDRGSERLGKRIAELEEEKERLVAAIERTRQAEADRRIREGQERAQKFAEKVRNTVEKAKSLPKEATLVIELAHALDGRSLEETFSGILRAAIQSPDLEVEKRHIEESFNLILDDVPRLKVGGHEEFRRAVEQLIGRKLVIERNMRWRRVAAEQKAADRDRAAQRLGFKALFGSKKKEQAL